MQNSQQCANVYYSMPQHETLNPDLDQLAAQRFGELALGMHVIDGGFLVPTDRNLASGISDDTSDYPGFETGWHILDRDDSQLQNGEWKESMVVLAKDDPELPGNVLIKRVPNNEFIEWQIPMRLAKKKAEQDEYKKQLDLERQAGKERKRQRNEKIFAPVGAPKKEPKDNVYDALTEDGEIFDDRLANLIKQRGLINSREYVTDENRQLASDLLNNSRLERGIKEIIRSVLPEQKAFDLRLVDEIRTNAELRLALGEHFLSRQEFYVDNNDYSIQRSVWKYLPDRVSRNTQKNPNHIGYEGLGLSSQEYVAELCLSMLDGSFDYNAASSDPINIKEDGEVVYGQHRAAALLVLLNEIPKQKKQDT